MSSDSTNWQEISTISFIMTGEADYFIANYSTTLDFNYNRKFDAGDIKALFDEIIRYVLMGVGDEPFFEGNISDLNGDTKLNLSDINQFMRMIRESITK